jgi:hypothetical protein
MKTISRITLASVLAVSASASNAAVIGDNNVIVNILNGDTGQSMLVDTNVAANALAPGWISATDLTGAIDSFISGASKVTFWVAGRVSAGFDKYAYTTKSFTDPVVVKSFVDTEIPSFITAANNPSSDFFNLATEGASEDWLAGIDAGTPISYFTPGILGNGIVTEIALGTDAQFFSSQTGFFAGTKIQALDNWRLDADGTLTYGAPAVPVPAAVWLMGSGLLGLVGVARRRKAS